VEKNGWVKKHVDTVIVLGGILGSVIWMNGKFNDVDHRFLEIERRFSSIENRLTKIETIIYIKGLVSQELAASKVEHVRN